MTYIIISVVVSYLVFSHFLTLIAIDSGEETHKWINESEHKRVKALSLYLVILLLWPIMFPLSKLSNDVLKASKGELFRNKKQESTND